MMSNEIDAYVKDVNRLKIKIQKYKERFEKIEREVLRCPVLKISTMYPKITAEVF